MRHVDMRPRGGSLCMFAVMFCLGMGLSAALAEDTDWQKNLREQLKTEKHCELNFMTGVFEGRLGTQNAVSGRAHCMDKRQFDFKREREKEAFSITACEPVAC